MSEKKIKNVIPIGIFLIVFLILLLLSAAVSISYFYFEAKNRITEIETYTRNYSIPLAEAFANVAELSYKDKSFTRLKRLFREKIKASIIDEAFFVLSDGKIVVHSDLDIEKELKGNIATDEFAYNLDLIMLPIWTKVDHAQFMDYHIYNPAKKIPFNKEAIKYFKKYIYEKIDVSGWLVTRAVNVRGKSIGCISFIISKERIYKFLLEHYDLTVKLSIVLAVLSFLISFFVSVIIFIRYRSLNKVRYYKTNIDKYDKIEPLEGNIVIENKVKEAIKIKPNTNSVKIKEFMLSGKKMIKDAILIKDKQGSNK